MAEFLVYNKSHWMDSLSAAEIADKIKKNLITQAKYDARYQKGDIVEVRPDGFWTDGKRKGFGSHAFALVVIPGIKVADAEKYMQPQEDLTNPEKPVLLKRRKYQMDMTQISLTAEKKAEVTTIADAHIVDKSRDING